MQATRVRTWSASLLALGMLVMMVRVAGHEEELLVPAVLPAVAAVLFHGRKMQAQLVARAAIWAALVLNMLLAHIAYRHPGWAMGAVVSGALALLVAGRIAESSEPSAFRPVAYQKTLTLSLVLVLADTFTAWMWTAFAFLAGAPLSDSLGFLICAVVTLVAAIGLYRLRMWALALSVIANIGIAIAFGMRIIDVHELRIVFVTSALAQLVVALPVLAGVILRRPLELPGWLSRSSRVLYPAALLGVIALAVQPLFGPSILRRIAEWWLH